MSRMDSTAADRPITRFYLGQAVHSTGRTIDEIMSMSDSDLDRAHNVIQWLFPSDKPSVYWINSPFLSKGEVELFKTKPIFRRNYIMVFNRYISLFGITNLGNIITIKPDFNSERRWLYPNSHAFMRITIILESMNLLGFTKEAHLLLKALIDINEKHGKMLIDKTTLSLWAKIGIHWQRKEL
jgi:hypothetical protein